MFYNTNDDSDEEYGKTEAIDWLESHGFHATGEETKEGYEIYSNGMKKVTLWFDMGDDAYTIVSTDWGNQYNESNLRRYIKSVVRESLRRR